MGCNCGGTTSSGAAIVYQLHVEGQPIRTFATKEDAMLARTHSGGRGVVIRTTQPAK